MPTGLLLINGPCGVGKSSLAAALGKLLEQQEIAHAQIDLDALTQFYPRDASDPFAAIFAASQLRALQPGYASLGIEVFIVARVCETQEDIDRIQLALKADHVTHVMLLADDMTIASRLAMRETGETLNWHVARAAELVGILHSAPDPDLSLDTNDRPPEELAQIVLRDTPLLQLER
ncbi:hypothetical protein [Qingshengfaniella alkalisoli]|uniref:Adenylylsulfate kinase n=1 Tax=Qingshengfaniella alkalisoli TaxID=2599296 RepID=A0A5B8IU19_9RHOB|nr:hypothetical protein [Qingshengfaniella alkalisoli]QDY68963.1 hypothetical protein FPZ52_04525 [Qingshengfaniella alkalisoli]